MGKLWAIGDSLSKKQFKNSQKVDGQPLTLLEIKVGAAVDELSRARTEGAASDAHNMSNRIMYVTLAHE